MEYKGKTFSDFATDHRKLKPGMLFIAIKGTQHDGHAHIEEALNAQAVACVIETSNPLSKKFLGHPKCVSVENTRKAWAEISAVSHSHPSGKMLVCGITGTNGKTTSTYLLESVLKAAGQKPAVIGTVENRFENTKITATHTTPSPPELQRLFSQFLNMGATAIAMEVSSHALDQERTWATQFAGALFTNLTQDHLDYHLSMEEYFHAKAKFFLEYPLKTRAVHIDDVYGKKLHKLCVEKKLPVLTFGKSADADVNLSSLISDKSGIIGALSYNSQSIAVHSPLIGAFNAQNIAGVATLALGLGLGIPAIEQGIQECKAVPGRLEKVHSQKGLSVFVDYAHTPDALENVLKTLRPLCRGKLVCLFGCGGDRDATKRPLMGAVAQRLADRLILTSDNPRTEDQLSILEDVKKGFTAGFIPLIEPDRKKAIELALTQLQLGDILLIAGKGHEDYQIIGTQKYPFDDREIAKEMMDAI